MGMKNIHVPVVVELEDIVEALEVVDKVHEVVPSVEVVPVLSLHSRQS